LADIFTKTSFIPTPIARAPQYYFKQFLRGIKGNVLLSQHAQKMKIPKGSGKTGTAFRYHPLPKVTTALTEGTNPTTKSFDVTTVQVTLAQWGDAYGVSDFVSDTWIDRRIGRRSENLGIQAEESKDWQLNLTLGGNLVSSGDSAGAYFTIATRNATYEIDSAITDSATHCTTKSCLLTTTYTTADFYKGGWVTFYQVHDSSMNRGKCYGYSRKIVAYDGTSGVIWWTTALPEIPDATQRAHIVLPGDGTGTTSGLTQGTHVLKSPALRQLIFQLKKNKAPKFAGGYYKVVMSLDDANDIQADTIWQAVKEYQDKMDLYKGYEGSLWGGDLQTTTEPFRYDIDGTSFPAIDNDTDLPIVWGIGQDAYAVAGLSGKQDTEFIFVSGADSNNRLNMNSSLGWKSTVGWVSTNACWVVGMLTSPTYL